jgi:hypothetical protein
MIKKLLNKIKSTILNIKAVKSLIYSEDLKSLIKAFKTYKDKHYKFITDPEYVNLKVFKTEIKKYAKTNQNNDSDLLEAIEDKEYVRVVHDTVKGKLTVKSDKVSSDSKYDNLPAIEKRKSDLAIQENAWTQYSIMLSKFDSTFIEKLNSDASKIRGSIDFSPKETKPDVNLTKEIAQDIKEIHSSSKKEVFDECFVTIFPVI